MKIKTLETKETGRYVLSALVTILTAVSLIVVTPALAQDKRENKDLNKTVKITTKTKTTGLQSKTVRTKSGDTTRTSRSSYSSTSYGSNDMPEPTKVDLIFPTLVKPDRTVKGKVKFKDYDDYVFTIFITVFFPDGDVVTSTLYDYREEGGDVWKGTIEFWVDIPDSETPLPGKIVITCTDEFLNVTQTSKTFIQGY